jgi:hypothetical protein
MKITELQKIIKQAVREAIQEEMKDILLEAVRFPKHTIYENKMGMPIADVEIPNKPNPVMSKSREEIRENYMKVLGGMMPGANGTLSVNTNSMPLQMHGPMDTTNGQLPQGDVPMDMILGLMKK